MCLIFCVEFCLVRSRENFKHIHSLQNLKSLHIGHALVISTMATDLFLCRHIMQSIRLCYATSLIQKELIHLRLYRQVVFCQPLGSSDYYYLIFPYSNLSVSCQYLLLRNKKQMHYTGPPPLKALGLLILIKVLDHQFNDIASFHLT